MRQTGGGRYGGRRLPLQVLKSLAPLLYTTPSPSKASVFAGYPSPYAEGGNVMPLLLRGDYIKRADAFDLRPEISGREGQRILNETLEGMGYAGVVFIARCLVGCRVGAGAELCGVARFAPVSRRGADGGIYPR